MNNTDLVFQSYGRCCRKEAFFEDFYHHFMASSDDIRALFRDTDMAAQRHLLRHGVMQLILYARGMSDRKLRALGESHSRRRYNIRPEWYALWLDALVKTVRAHDPDYTPELGAAWREVLMPGINLIRDAY
ncbi:globin [Marinobacter lutaoensis]|jgi:hemoglobin-like flavoprotein|uniref:Globin n=1 Tax=Marinobacter lutaoensis TaxID=135739 RepID=A0A1V2DW24_9GAMM|nr:globin [Marinobacter lutaoensis]MBE03255.1 globin [Marinobacter sp.]MBI43999.1 globin [Oceanospirillales bacterium]NVD34329.1 globin [Marinobacter lutaoensis]ONF44471.1 globin [Marinobacter lutaoensis]|tara:strand:+ start:1097 stop:1489 length:393 start_codon:yes stop_codon:yes gene_type:complete